MPSLEQRISKLEAAARIPSQDRQREIAASVNFKNREKFAAYLAELVGDTEPPETEPFTSEEQAFIDDELRRRPRGEYETECREMQQHFRLSDGWFEREMERWRAVGGLA